jgi:hypothetical protein
VPVYAWVCLGVFVILVVSASAVMLVATIRLFRGLRAAGPDLEFGLQGLANRTAALTARTERVAESFARAEASARALADSRAQLQTLLWALQDVRRLAGLALSIVSPRK